MVRFLPIKPSSFAAAVLLAFAAAVAPLGSAAQTAPALIPAVPTTHIVAIGHLTDAWTPDAMKTVMPSEVRETVKLHLAGKIEQWYSRKDKRGVVFVLNVTDVEEARKLLEALPLGQAKMMAFDLIPLGPLAPLGMLVGP